MSKQSLHFGNVKMSVAESVAVNKMHCSLSIGSKAGSPLRRPETIVKPKDNNQNEIIIGRDSQVNFDFGKPDIAGQKDITEIADELLDKNDLF